MSIDSRHKDHQLGAFGEAFAATYVERCLGWNVIKRNVRTRFGEIDAIAAADDELVFIEVKTRTSVRFGDPIEAVSDAKIARLVGQAEYYVATTRVRDEVSIALDVIGLLVCDGAVVSVRHDRIYP